MTLTEEQHAQLEQARLQTTTDKKRSPNPKGTQFTPEMREKALNTRRQKAEERKLLKEAEQAEKNAEKTAKLSAAKEVINKSKYPAKTAAKTPELPDISTKTPELPVIPEATADDGYVSDDENEIIPEKPQKPKALPRSIMSKQRDNSSAKDDYYKKMSMLADEKLKKYAAKHKPQEIVEAPPKPQYNHFSDDAYSMAKHRLDTSMRSEMMKQLYADSWGNQSTNPYT